MKYEIKGGSLPVVEVHLEAGEQVISENGAMSWMSGNMKLETTSNAGGNGGLGKLLGRALSGESLFQNVFTAQDGPGMVAFTSSFPGTILAVEITPGNDVICQKSAFLASTTGVQLSTHLQKAGAGFLGGEGFILQKLSGNGIAFLEIDGSTVDYELAAGEKMIVDQGFLAMMSATCNVDIVVQKGIKNLLLSGDGMTNTVITGPGKITLQTMPIQQVAGSIIPFIPSKN